VVLVEEPEKGIHPKRLQDVLAILRELVSQQKQTQIILTTHSPYVVDLFEPEEVTLCQKQPDGSVAVRRLSESRAVREQLDVFTLGEIWTAEGDEALVEPAVADGESQG
jgi:predicted ATPase